MTPFDPIVSTVARQHLDSPEAEAERRESDHTVCVFCKELRPLRKWAVVLGSGERICIHCMRCALARIEALEPGEYTVAAALWIEGGATALGVTEGK